MECIFVLETYERGVSALWRSSAALLRWQRLAIRMLSLSAQRAAAARALRAREEGATFPRRVSRLRNYGEQGHMDGAFARRVRQRCCELAVGLL